MADRRRRDRCRDRRGDEARSSAGRLVGRRRRLLRRESRRLLSCSQCTGDPLARELGEPTLAGRLACLDLLDRAMDRREQPSLLGERRLDRLPSGVQPRDGRCAFPSLLPEQRLALPDCGREAQGRRTERGILRRQHVRRLEPVDHVRQALRSGEDVDQAGLPVDVERDEPVCDSLLRGVQVAAGDAERDRVDAQAPVDRREPDASTVVGLHDVLEVDADPADLGQHRALVCTLGPDRRRRRSRGRGRPCRGCGRGDGEKRDESSRAHVRKARAPGAHAARVETVAHASGGRQRVRRATIVM